MSLISRISDQLKDANARIGGLERSVAARPQDLALRYSLSSIEKHREELESELEQTTARFGIDVCNYRLFGTGEAVAARLFRALAEFQDFLTLTFAAVKSGPKQTRHVGDEYVEATALGFSHSYAGSAGFVFTLPQEKILFEETDLDAAFAAVFQMAKLSDIEGIREFAALYGRGVIRELYEWSAVHADNGLGADIDWRRGPDVRKAVFVQPQELAYLRELIAKTSDRQRETFTLRGFLVGIDSQTRRFHFRPDGEAADIRGALSEDIAVDEDHAIAVPVRYRAEIEKTTTVHYSTDQEQVEYLLVDLRGLPAADQ